MLEAITTLWSIGTQGQPPALRRQIALSNQLALFGAVATSPYQIYAFFYWADLWLPFYTSLVYTAVCAATLLLNRYGHYNAARNLYLTGICIHLFVSAYLLGTDVGVHFYFFTLGAILPLLYFRQPLRVLLGIGSLMGLLFIACELFFSTNSPPAPVAGQHVIIMYFGSVTGAIGLMIAFAFLFRIEIDRVEKELTVLNDDLQKLSTTDGLTLLMNRRGMDEALDQEWARMRREGGTLSVLMCDVDYFKPYNDYYGHQAGDVCLQRISSVLKGSARRPLDRVARYGGEEFVVILPRANKANARFMCERIRRGVEALSIEHKRSAVGPFVTVSLGYSTMTPQTDFSVKQLLVAADVALYEAKRSGRNRSAFECPLAYSEAG